MLGNDDKWEKREARIRGSGTRSIKLEQFSIESPESSRQRRISLNLESAFTKPDDLARPRLRQTRGRAGNKAMSKVPETKAVLRQENRKLRFSSEEEEEGDERPENDTGFDPRSPFTSSHIQTEVYSKSKNEANFDVGHEFDELEIEKETETETEMESREKQTLLPDSVKQEQTDGASAPENEAKRRRGRGRPKKTEQEKKVAVVTRRSRRIVDNPSLRQAHVPDPSVLFKVARPLRAFGLALLLPYQLKEEGLGEPVLLGAGSSSARGRGKHRPLVIDAERVYTPSTRTRRVNLNTLDVIQQYVEEYEPRPAQNDVVNENVVLTEFKAHLKYNLAYLMDQHASIIDISQDINDVQRRKNDMRRKILELRKAHANVGAELAKERKAYADNKAQHQQFMAMANSLRILKQAVLGGSLQLPSLTGTSTSELVHEQLAHASRIMHPTTGLLAQLQGINAALAETIRRLSQ